MFDSHYKLKSDEIFHIIIQLSRFFKDFSDFETPSTPDFRHPPIKGGSDMEQIGISFFVFNNFRFIRGANES